MKAYVRVFSLILSVLLLLISMAACKSDGSCRHSMVPVAKKDATCTEDGHIEHWRCSLCDKTFSTEDGSEELTDVTIPAGHTGGTTVNNQRPPTEAREGYTGDTYCIGCGRMLEEGKVIERLKHTHRTAKVSRKESTCQLRGHVEHWICIGCGNTFEDADATVDLLDVMLPLAEHRYGEWIPEVPADCDDEGVLGHYHCPVCDKDFDAQKNPLSSLVIPVTHTGGTEQRNEKAATEYQDGYTGDTYCLGCGDLISEGSVIPHTSDTPAIVVSRAEREENLLTLEISLVNNPGIVSLKFDLLYDAQLSIQTIDFADEFGAYVTSPEPYINPQTVNWMTTGGNVSTEGVFMTVTFLLTPDASESTVEVRIIPDSSNIFDYETNQVTFDAVGTTVTIGE